MNALAQLAMIADAAAGERQIPPLMIDAFRLALGDIASGRATADEAFGLSVPRGGRKVSTSAAYQVRDRELVLALAECDMDAGKLSVALSRYRSTAWRRERVLAECPARHAGRLEARLWAILQARDCSLSDRRIRGIAAARK